MAGTAGVAEKRHLTKISTDIRAADADLVDTNERLARTGFVRARNVDVLPVLR
jgi:hypothetical protein